MTEARLNPIEGALGQPAAWGRLAAGLSRAPSVVEPRDSDAVAAALADATRSGLAVAPLGGGTAATLGNALARLDLVLDLTRLDALVEYRPQDLTVTVGAGMTVAALQERLAREGQMVALDPPLTERATIGGVLAADISGPRRQRYGTARDLVIGSTAVLADGTTVRAGGRVVKNVAGYDLNKLWIGSAGTLAVIVQATLKVLPLPPASGTLVGAFASAGSAQAAAMAVAGGVLRPLALDLINPAAAGRLALGERGKDDASWLLAVELGGSAAAVERATAEVGSLMGGAGAARVTVLERGAHEALGRRLRDFGRSDEDSAAVIVRVSVLPSDTVAAVEALARVGAEAVIARAGRGVAYGYWFAEPGAALGGAVRSLRTSLAPLRAQVVIEHALPEAKDGIDAWGLDGPDSLLMRRIKRTYDPTDTLSPGRLFPSEGP